MSLSAKSQAVARIEDLEGSAETANITAADLIEVLADTFPVVKPSNESIKRNPARGSLTKLQPIPGGREGSMTLQAELAGPVITPAANWSHDNGAPSFAILLRACGMQMLKGLRVKVDATGWTGAAAYHGEVLTPTTSSASFKLFGDVIMGEDLYIHVVDESFSGALVGTDITFTAAGGAVVTAPDPTATHSDAHGNTVNNQVDCLVYAPYDDEVSELHHDAGSGTWVVGEIITGGTSGAKASVVGGKLNAVAATTVAAPLLMSMLVGSAAFVDGETITGAGGATATVDDSVSTYVQRQRDVPSLTLQSRHNGPVLSCKGARGNWTLTCNNRDRPMFTFEMRGAGLPPVDATNFAFGSGIRNNIPPVTVGSTLLFDGTVSPLFGGMSYKSGNTLGLRDSPTDSSASGYLSTRITDREPMMEIESEALRAAIFDAWSKHYDKTSVRSTQKFLSPIKGNSFEIRCRGIAIDDNAPTDKEGFLGTQGTYSLNASSTAPRGELFNDEWILVQY